MSLSRLLRWGEPQALKSSAPRAVLEHDRGAWPRPQGGPDLADDSTAAVVDLAQHRAERLDTNYRPTPFSLPPKDRRAAKRGIRRARLALARAKGQDDDQ